MSTPIVLYSLVHVLAYGLLLYLGARVRRSLELKYERLAEEVGLDDLTRVYRRGAGERLMRLSLRAYPCVVAFCDLREFGAINKRLGWAAGDAALRAFAGAVLSHFPRAHDTIFRYGGDEFFIVCPLLNNEAQTAIVDTDVLGHPRLLVPPPPIHDLVNSVRDRLAQVAGDSGVEFDFAVAPSCKGDIAAHDPAEVVRIVMETVRRTKESRSLPS